mmetsp:Transcript_43302/g.87585  ORF Transcript_43302/g.87585 Transcript_43302/m.87585 type:complete len:312 (-) Transcript_43302:135-1070(-)
MDLLLRVRVPTQCRVLPDELADFDGGLVQLRVSEFVRGLHRFAPLERLRLHCLEPLALVQRLVALRLRHLRRHSFLGDRLLRHLGAALGGFQQCGFCIEAFFQVLGFPHRRFQLHVLAHHPTQQRLALFFKRRHAQLELVGRAQLLLRPRRRHRPGRLRVGAPLLLVLQTRPARQQLLLCLRHAPLCVPRKHQGFGFRFFRPGRAAGQFGLQRALLRRPPRSRCLHGRLVVAPRVQKHLLLRLKRLLVLVARGLHLVQLLQETDFFLLQQLARELGLLFRFLQCLGNLVAVLGRGLELGLEPRCERLRSPH